jgi:hypothetical protein
LSNAEINEGMKAGKSKGNANTKQVSIMKVDMYCLSGLLVSVAAFRFFFSLFRHRHAYIKLGIITQSQDVLPGNKRFTILDVDFRKRLQLVNWLPHEVCAHTVAGFCTNFGLVINDQFSENILQSLLVVIRQVGPASTE